MNGTDCERCDSIHGSFLVDGSTYCAKCHDALCRIWGRTQAIQASGEAITFYMILDAKTGKFSKGGTAPRWGTHNEGKVWRKIGHARTAITNTKEYGTRYGPSLNQADWRIIEFTVPASSGIDKGNW